MDITITPYDNKSFKVSGQSTIYYTNQLRALGGEYLPYLPSGPGWRFSNIRKNDVINFINDIRSKQLAPSRLLESPSSAITTGASIPVDEPLQLEPLPIIGDFVNIPNIADPKADYQTVVYTIFRPRIGMIGNITISSATNIFQFEVVQVEEHEGIVDGVYIKPRRGGEDADLSKLVIVNGKWQVLGLMDSHEVTFISI